MVVQPSSTAGMFSSLLRVSIAANANRATPESQCLRCLSHICFTSTKYHFDRRYLATTAPIASVRDTGVADQKEHARRERLIERAGRAPLSTWQQAACCV